MPNYWSSIINPMGAGAQPVAVVYNNSVTLTDVSFGAASNGACIIPANTLVVGSTIRCNGLAKFSNTGTPTLLNGIYYGAVAGTKLAATAATTTTTAATNWQVRIFYEGTVTAVGTSGSIVGGGFVLLGTSLTAVTTIPIDASATAAVTIDTSAAKALTWGAQWGTQNASNTMTVMNWTVELFQPA
jgi:hypothetical protein